MSLANRHKAKVLAATMAANSTNSGTNAGRAVNSPAARPVPPQAPAAFPHAAAGSPESREAAQMALRFTHDVRRLKEIKSIDAKVAAKSEMLPAYRGWILGQLESGAAIGEGVAAEILPTCMVWLIDVGDYDAALDLAEFMLRHDVTLPARYQRDTASLVVEEIAEQALKADTADAAFPLEILDRVDSLAIGRDLHDEIRAKLNKAIGAHQLAFSESLAADESRPALEKSLAMMKEAVRLNPRVGVKDRIKRAEKLLRALDDAAQLAQAGEPAQAAQEPAQAPAPAKFAVAAKPAAKTAKAPAKRGRPSKAPAK